MTEERKKITLPYLFEKVERGEPITWLTCYDFPTAYLQEQAGIEMILVGDSLGMTMLGFDSTLPVKMDDMIRHASAVRKGAPNVFLVACPTNPAMNSRCLMRAVSWLKLVAMQSNSKAVPPWLRASRRSPTRVFLPSAILV